MLVLSRGRSQEGRDFGRILGDWNARIREGLHLRFGRPFARLDDRPRVPHPFSWRRAATGDVGHHRLRDLPSDEIGRFFLGRPADLPHEHNALRRPILLEPGEGLTMLVPMIGSPPIPMHVVWPKPAWVIAFTIS